MTASSLFPAAEEKRYAVGQLRLAPEGARRLRPQLKSAFVVAPKEPYLIKDQQKVGEPTISTPLDVTEDFSILVADIQCGLLMDGSNKVLGPYPTR